MITIGGRLNAKWCIHAVGPNYRVHVAANHRSLEDCDKLIYSAYLKSMKLAAQHGIKTIAFSLLSAGVFRGPQTLQQVLNVAVDAIVDGAYEGLQEVHLCAFKSEEKHCLHNMISVLSTERLYYLYLRVCVCLFCLSTSPFQFHCSFHRWWCSA